MTPTTKSLLIKAADALTEKRKAAAKAKQQNPDTAKPATPPTT